MGCLIQRLMKAVRPNAFFVNNFHKLIDGHLGQKIGL